MTPDCPRPHTIVVSLIFFIQIGFSESVLIHFAALPGITLLGSTCSASLAEVLAHLVVQNFPIISNIRYYN